MKSDTYRDSLGLLLHGRSRETVGESSSLTTLAGRASREHTRARTCARSFAREYIGTLPVAG